MTEATAPRAAIAALPTVQYRVAVPAPSTHMVEVSLTLTDWQEASLDVVFPVWTPGSYLVREYARHLQEFAAVDAAGRSLPWRKLSKNHWHIETGTERRSPQSLTLTYRLYANELTVRTNHVDASHAYLNGAATFLRVPALTNQPVLVTVQLPHPDWQVATTLVECDRSDRSRTYQAADFDELVDSPIELGRHHVVDFAAGGKAHQLAIWGQGNLNPTDLIAPIQQIIAAEASIFGDELPYDRYLFLLHLSASGYGGLEHKNSCSLNYPRFGFANLEKRERFLQLVAHEFFHLWNVKRIRPIELQTFDYDCENYTPSLWFCEGVTSYYDLLIPLRAGIYDRRAFLAYLSKDITRFLTTPGRLVQPLRESSFDAWIKLYRREAHSDNHQMSYYLKGQLVALLLDLLIRDRSDNRRSLDDVMRRLWQDYGREEVGYSAAALEGVIAEVADVDLSDFFARYLDTTEPLPLGDYLERFGLKLRGDATSQAPYLGIRVASEAGREVIKFVEAESPAWVAGVDPGDELLAIDGVRVNAEQLGDRLRDYAPGDRMALSVFHGDELKTYVLNLASPQALRYTLTPIHAPTPDQQNRLDGWLGPTRSPRPASADTEDDSVPTQPM